MITLINPGRLTLPPIRTRASTNTASLPPSAAAVNSEHPSSPLALSTSAICSGSGCIYCCLVSGEGMTYLCHGARQSIDSYFEVAGRSDIALGFRAVDQPQRASYWRVYANTLIVGDDGGQLDATATLLQDFKSNQTGSIQVHTMF